MGFFSVRTTSETAKLNPVQDPQLLPNSHAMLIISPRMASPAASAYMPENFFAAVFKQF